MHNIYSKINEILQKGECLALCTIVSAKGSVPMPAGTKMLVGSEGRIWGTIGGGNLEKKVIENAAIVLKNRSSKLFMHELMRQHHMCCGGTVQIFVETLMPMEKLYIFGSGHIGRAVAKLAVDVGFETFLVDPRDKELDQLEGNSVNKLPFEYIKMIAKLPFDDQTYIVICTYDHTTDRKILEFCLHQPFAYLGMIGSKRKVEISRKLFLHSGFVTEEEWNRIDAPVGIDIGAEGPAEIAVSIMARLIEVRRKKPAVQHPGSKPESAEIEKMNVV